MKKGYKLQHKCITSADPTGSYDSKEEIEGCLHCCKSDCRNCSTKGQRVRGGMSSFDYDLLKHYPHFPSDISLSKAMNCSRLRVVNHRENLGLPDPSTLTMKERKRISQEKLAV